MAFYPRKLFFVGTHGNSQLRTFKQAPRTSRQLSVDQPAVVDHRIAPLSTAADGSRVSVGSRIFRVQTAQSGPRRPVQALSLVGLSPWNAGKSRLVKETPLVIGQGQRWLVSSGLRVQSDPHVRLVHAEIALGGGQYYIHPYGPAQVNGRFVFKPTALNAGDVITLGKTRFAVQPSGETFTPRRFRPTPLDHPTFSPESEQRHLAFLQSPHAMHHPFLQWALPGANMLTEGRALRHAQLISEIQSNLRFFDSIRKGRAELEAPADGYDFCAKHVLRPACLGIVDQPDFSVLNYAGRSSDRDSLRLDSKVTDVARMLQRSGSIFIKPTGTSLAYGLTRMTLNRGTLAVTSRHVGFLQTLVGMGASVKSPRVVQLDVSGRRLQNVLRRVLDHGYGQVMLNALGNDKAIVEEAIPIAKLGGKTWEIRSFHQRVGPQRQLTYQYAKVGAGDFVANVAAGGSRSKPAALIRQLYLQRYPTISDKRLDRLSREFMDELSRQSDRLVGHLERHLQRHVERHANAPLLRRPTIDHLCTDFTGVFGDDGKLHPVLMEVNKVGTLSRKQPDHVLARRNLDAMIQKQYAHVRSALGMAA